MKFYDAEEITAQPDGVYLCYVNHEHVKTTAERVLLMKYNDEFYYRYSDQRYRDHVYGGYGPVPTMKLELPVSEKQGEK